MGKDGVWTSGLDGARTAQIVEFPGQLDCALSLTPVVIPDPPPPPPPPPPVPGRFRESTVARTSTTTAIPVIPVKSRTVFGTAQGQFCPVGAQDCTATYQAATCPTGTSLNTLAISVRQTRYIPVQPAIAITVRPPGANKP